jgi:hypothetical protein
MIGPTRADIMHALEELSQQHPNWRFGQLVVNVSVWAREWGPVEFWDLEDTAFLHAIQTHLEQQRNLNNQTSTTIHSSSNSPSAGHP